MGTLERVRFCENEHGVHQPLVNEPEVEYAELGSQEEWGFLWKKVEWCEKVHMRTK